GSTIDVDTFFGGAPGSIDSAASNVVLVNGFTQIFGTTIPVPAVIGGESVTGGSAGNIRIQTGSLQLLGLASINAATGSDLPGGNISINAKDILLDGRGLGASIFSGTFGAKGKGGDITIRTQTLQLLNLGVVSSESLDADGNGGNIFVTATSLL